jgi:hypothetical protein
VYSESNEQAVPAARSVTGVACSSGRLQFCFTEARGIPSSPKVYQNELLTGSSGAVSFTHNLKRHGLSSSSTSTADEDSGSEKMANL